MLNKLFALFFLIIFFSCKIYNGSSCKKTENYFLQFKDENNKLIKKGTIGFYLPRTEESYTWIIREKKRILYIDSTIKGVYLDTILINKLFLRDSISINGFYYNENPYNYTPFVIFKNKKKYKIKLRQTGASL